MQPFQECKCLFICLTELCLFSLCSHVAAVCTDEPLCYRCLQRGHTAAFCPRNMVGFPCATWPYSALTHSHMKWCRGVRMGRPSSYLIFVSAYAADFQQIMLQLQTKRPLCIGLYLPPRLQQLPPAGPPGKRLHCWQSVSHLRG